MKPRFEPDNERDAIDAHSPSLIDPEAYDASEQTFAASLEQTAASKTPRFVVEPKFSEPRFTIEDENVDVPVSSSDRLANEADLRAESKQHNETSEKDMAASPPTLAEVEAPPDPESWRSEVAARLSHYRARRRPREPRYPSLQLKFEIEPVWGSATANPPDAEGGADLSSIASQEMSEIPSIDDHLASARFAHRVPETPATAPRIRLAEPLDQPRALFVISNEATAKVIDFASYSAPPRPIDELAEPVFDRPRIIEAPELLLPPPALGGISIEPAEEPANDRRPGFEIPLQAAPMGRRVAAAGIDAVLVVAAITAFSYIFFRITGEVPSPAKVAVTASLLAGVFWCAYQYLLLVYSGITPGLKLARLELQRFDGDPVPRNIRRWRVLASVLSGVSLGLGYAWCLLDEDELCWHDRITRTYMAPKK
jgi:uncharacterized RDD family membrane protein YckC